MGVGALGALVAGSKKIKAAREAGLAVPSGAKFLQNLGAVLLLSAVVGGVASYGRWTEEREEAAADEQEAAEEAAQLEAAISDLNTAVESQDWLAAEGAINTVKGLDPENPVLTQISDRVSTEIAALEEEERLAAVDAGLALAARVTADKELCNTGLKVSEAWEGVRQAKPTDENWRAVQRATSKLERCRVQIEHELSEGIRTVMQQQRERLCSEMEDKMLDKGLDMRFQARRRNKDELRITWVLMSRPSVHQITDGGSMAPGAFLRNMQDAGFRKVVFADGYRESYSYDLNPESEEGGGSTALEGMGLREPLALVAE